MINALLAIGFILSPALILYLCHKNSLLAKIGAAGLSYVFGLLISLSGVIPSSATPVLETLMNLTVPLSIPLLLFSMDLKRWLKLAPRTFLSLGLILASALISSTVMYLVLGRTVDEAWKVSGMLVGMYSGGAPNMNAIGLALKVDEHVLILANTADMILGAALFMFYLSVAQRIYLKFLPAFKPPASAAAFSARTDPLAADLTEAVESEKADFTDYSDMFNRRTLVPLSGAFGLAAAIFALGLGVYFLSPPSLNMAALMLTITTLGLAASFAPRIRRIPKSFQLGQYIILIFCVVIGAAADINRLVSAASDMLIYIAAVLFGAVILHLILSALLRVDADTTIITSIAAVYSPPFVPAVAAALKNKDVIVSGLATGIIGYAVGNYLGIALGHLIHRLF